MNQEVIEMNNQNNRKQFHLEEFGENVWFFTPEDDVKEVQAVLDDIYRRQEAAQFGSDRDAVYFMPGKYDESLRVNVGFYTQISGLGISPKEVEIPSLQCMARWLRRPNNNNATCNFWRGVENLTVGSDTMWAVSQATYMRRVHVKGKMELHDERGWASGGFMADSKVDGVLDSGTQQQWLSRNCDWKEWTGANWNIVFAGCAEGKVPTETWPVKAYTAVDKVDKIQEKPYLIYDEKNGLGVFVPKVRTNCKDISWAVQDAGKVLPIKEFYIAGADRDSSDTLNEALEAGKHLFFTPGIYHLEKELIVESDDAILLGTGLATLVPDCGNRCIHVTGTGITLAGLLFDAGPQKSDTLLEVAHCENGREIYLSDLFFRVGGVADYVAQVDSCLILHCDHVIGDNFWVWRADHGANVAWDRNIARNGIIINGNDVTIYALMVEHFEEFQTVWNGEDGKVIMYQSELPYDVPNQGAWISHDGTRNGYASYYVAPHVARHEAWGLGIYSVFWDAEVEEYCVADVPETPLVRIHNICAILINGNPGITHVINDAGESCLTHGERHIITNWPM